MRKPGLRGRHLNGIPYSEFAKLLNCRVIVFILLELIVNQIVTKISVNYINSNF